MKTILLFFLIFFVNLQIVAQNLDWQWAYGGLNTSTQNLNIYTDYSGNIYSYGYFGGKSITFGDSTIFNPDTSGTLSAVFMLKFGAAGNIQWTRAASTINNVHYASVYIDGNNNLYLSGNFVDSLLVLGTDTLRNPGYSSNVTPLFIVKYNSAGNVVWAYEGDAGIILKNMVADSNGNVYVCGDFDAPTAMWGDSVLVNNISQNYFAARLDSLGKPGWAFALGGPEGGNVTTIAADNKGYCYVSGIFDASAVVVGGATLNGANNINAFTARINSSGQAAWATEINGNCDNIVTAIATDDERNVYVSGTINYDGGPAVNDSTYFGDLLLINPDIISHNNSFVAKYDATGNLVWVKTVKSAGSSGAGISVGANDHIYCAGNFSGKSAIFDNDTVYAADTNGQPQIYVVNYNSSGNVAWVASAGSDLGAYAGNIIADESGNFYLNGDFSGIHMILGNDTLQGTSDGEDQFPFIAKYGYAVTGITTPVDKETINVYPNPTSGQVYFKGVSPGSTLEIYDLLGQNIYSTVINTDPYLLNLKGNTRGMYLYRLMDKGSVAQMGKVVVN